MIGTEFYVVGTAKEADNLLIVVSSELNWGFEVFIKMIGPDWATILVY